MDKKKLDEFFIEVREGVFTFDIKALEKDNKDKKGSKKSLNDCCHSYRKGKRCKDCPFLSYK
jgi:hypothetical protein